jgi:hypothetical protein
MLQVFRVFRGMFRKSWGHGPGAGGRGAASRGPADGAHGAPRVLWTGHARPHPGSQVLLAPRVEEVKGKEWQAQQGCTCRVRRDRWGIDVRVHQRYGAAVGASGLGQQHARGVQTRSSPDIRVLVNLFAISPSDKLQKPLPLYICGPPSKSNILLLTSTE